MNFNFKEKDRNPSLSPQIQRGRTSAAASFPQPPRPSLDHWTSRSCPSAGSHWLGLLKTDHMRKVTESDWAIWRKWQKVTENMNCIREERYEETHQTWRHCYPVRPLSVQTVSALASQPSQLCIVKELYCTVRFYVMCTVGTYLCKVGNQHPTVLITPSNLFPFCLSFQQKLRRVQYPGNPGSRESSNHQVDLQEV